MSGLPSGVIACRARLAFDGSGQAPRAGRQPGRRGRKLTCEVQMPAPLKEAPGAQARGPIRDGHWRHWWADGVPRPPPEKRVRSGRQPQPPFVPHPNSGQWGLAPGTGSRLWCPLDPSLPLPALGGSAPDGQSHSCTARAPALWLGAGSWSRIPCGHSEKWTGEGEPWERSYI